jgi:regulator of sigma E protease
VTVYYVLLTVLGIGFLIFIHELGHYMAARAAGVRVLTFSLGFGRRIWGFVRNGTDYRVSLIPVGGYVAVAGMDNYDRRDLDADELHAKSFTARALFFSGGVLMNLLFAVIAFPLVFNAGVEFTAPVIGEVSPGGPAWRAGLRAGDRVLRLDGKPMYSFENMRVELALAGDDPVVLDIERGGAAMQVAVEPEYTAAEGLRMIGIAPAVEPEAPTIEVTRGGPAEAAGVKTGDLLLELDGQPVQGIDVAEKLGELAHAPVDVPVRLRVRRGASEVDITYPPAASTSPRLGIRPARRHVGGVRPNPVVQRLGLRAGDEVLEVDGTPFPGVDTAPFATGGSAITVVVARGQDRARHSLRAQGLSAEDRALLAESIALDVGPASTAVNLTEHSPARAAGVRDGDEILAVAGKDVASWPEIVNAVRGSAPGSIELRVRRAGGETALTVAAVPTIDLGFSASIAYRRERYQVGGVLPAVKAGLVCSVDLIKQLYVTLKRLFTGDVSARNLGGIIQISRVSYAYAESGWARFVYFLALLSINLAFINILPIPVLDGGHLLFLLIERVKGSPVSPKVLSYSQILGLVFVVGLMVFVTYNDIVRLF